MNCFVLQINQLVDILNSAALSNNGQKSAITEILLEERLCQLNEFQKWVGQWKFIDKRSPRPKVLNVLNFKTCLMETIAAVRGVVEFLIQTKYYKYVCTRRFTQDSVENLFSTLRRDSGGFNSRPEANKAIQTLRLVCCRMLLDPPKNKNCEDDGGDILLELGKYCYNGYHWVKA
jgi:hypothetical protein